MDLVFDVGNTETVIGWFEDTRLCGHWRVSTDGRRTADEYGLMLTQLMAAAGIGGAPVRAATIGSVVPALTLTLADACRRYLRVEAQAVNARTPLPIRLDVEEPLTVGADRLINTLVASRVFGRDVIVVDLGTATTFDCITADGVFLGGVISPGVRTSAETLFRRTSKLPATELTPPPRAIGRRTEACIRAGVVFGAAESIDGIVRRIKREWPRDEVPLVVATGGLAETLAPLCEEFDRVAPYLTLQGLQLAYELLRG